MKISEHEKALLAIESLAQQIGQRGDELEDQVLLNIASCLQLYLITALNGDLNQFMDHTNDFRDKKLKEAREALEDLLMEELTGKKVTGALKVLRRETQNDN